MTLLRHLLAADLRRHRLPLVAWLVVNGLAAAVEALSPMLDASGGIRASTELLANLLWLTELLLTALLIPLVVQGHPLVGSNAFWMTRPIRAELLLASKIVLLTAVIVVVPVMANVAVMATYHVPASGILSVSADTALFRTFWLTLLMVMAAFTPTLARLLMVVGGALVAITVALSIATAITLANIDHETPSTGTAQIPDPTTEVVLVGALILVGLAVLYLHYQRRSRVRSSLLGAAGVALAAITASAWPWPVLAPRLDAPAWATGSVLPRLVARADTVKAMGQTEGLSRRSRWRSVRALVHLEGLEPGWTSQALLREATVTLPGHGDLVSAAFGVSEVAARTGIQYPAREAAKAAMGVDVLVDNSDVLMDKSTATGTVSILTVRESDLRRVVPAVGAYRGRFQIVPTHLAIEGRLPLQVGATHQRGAYRVVVERVDLASGTATVEAVESEATAMFDRELQPQRTYYLRNQLRSEAVQGSSDSTLSSWSFLGFHVSGSSMGFSAQRLYVEFRPTVGEQTFTIDEDWLAGAELVIVGATMAQPFDRTLDIPDFPLRLDPPTPMAQETQEQ